MHNNLIYLVKINNILTTYPLHIWPIINELHYSFYDIKNQYSHLIKQENNYRFIEFEHYNANNHKIIIRIYGFIDYNKPGNFPQGYLPLTFFQVTSNNNFNKKYKRYLTIASILQ